MRWLHRFEQFLPCRCCRAFTVPLVQMLGVLPRMLASLMAFLPVQREGWLSDSETLQRMTARPQTLVDALYSSNRDFLHALTLALAGEQDSRPAQASWAAARLFKQVQHSTSSTTQSIEVGMESRPIAMPALQVCCWTRTREPACRATGPSQASPLAWSRLLWASGCAPPLASWSSAAGTSRASASRSRASRASR